MISRSLNPLVRDTIHCSLITSVLYPLLSNANKLIRISTYRLSPRNKHQSILNGRDDYKSSVFLVRKFVKKKEEEKS